MEANAPTILGVLLASVLVLLLPGFVWITWLAQSTKDFLGRLALAIGLSLSINAILAGLAFFLGVHVSATSLLLIYTVLGGLALISVGLLLRESYFRWQLERRQEVLEDPEKTTEETNRPSPAVIALAGLLFFGGLLFWRFYQIRDLALPVWVDPLHHVLIVRLILENSGLVATFDPYMPVPFYYHFGFHVSAALFSFWSTLPPAQAVLVIGQILNAAVALSIYSLGIAIWSDWRRAAVAGLVVGFVTQMPAYYVTWGRYTLLTGLVILPLAMAAALELLRFGWKRERVARLAVLTAGLLLTHYIAALLLAIFLIIALVYSFIQRRYLESSSGWAGAWSGVLGGAAAGFLIAAPWLVRVWEYARAYTTITSVSLDTPLDTIYFSDYLRYLWYLLGPLRNYVLLALAFLGMVVAGWRRRTVPLVIWTVVLLLLCIPWGLHLTPLRPDHILIVLFIPAALLFADGLVTVLDGFQRRGWGWPVAIVSGFVLMFLIAWGVWDTRVIVNPVTLIADRADRDAISWVAENTPPEARFYVNTIHWQNGVYRGVDGGWWIMPLTGRTTLVPPTMYLLGDLDYVERINGWGARASRLQACTSEMWSLFREARLDYVYVKEGEGALQAPSLDTCPGLQEVYNRGGVHIYVIDSQVRDSPQD